MKVDAMIDALDHVTISGSARVYETLLDSEASMDDCRAAMSGWLRGRAARRCRVDGVRHASLDKAAHLLERRAVARTSGAQLLSSAASHGVPIAFVERARRGPLALHKSARLSAIAALDHVVVRTPNPERAVAFYAGRLGLDLRLDRSNPEWGAGCCSSAAAISWSRSRTTSTRA